MAGLIHLVRHGEVHNPDNVCYADIESFGLSERGFAQAKAAGQRVAATPAPGVVSAYVSPLRRARETFETMNTGVTPTPVADLTEWGLAQRWKGERWDDLDELYPGEVDAYWRDPTDLPFSPESLEELADRMVRVARSAVTQSGAAVIVGHQDPIQAARLVLTGQDLSALHSDKPAHGSVITLQATGGPWRELAHWVPHRG